MNYPTSNHDFVPVTGGVDLAKYLRDDVDDLRNLRIASDLDKRIVQLLALHPALRMQFRNQDLTTLDDATKQTLLQDMNHVLGIRPLKSPRR
jgi:hypothetical protein